MVVQLELPDIAVSDFAVSSTGLLYVKDVRQQERAHSAPKNRNSAPVICSPVLTDSPGG